jgi:nitroreductase
MAEAAKAPKARYASEDRIGVLEELLNERYSVRAFLPRPVPNETIDRLLTVAQRTASWCNSQPWQVLIASGAAKERFRKAIYAAAASGDEEGRALLPFYTAYRAIVRAKVEGMENEETEVPAEGARRVGFVVLNSAPRIDCDCHSGGRMVDL